MRRETKQVHYHAAFFPNLTIVQFIDRLGIKAKHTRRGTIVIEGEEPQRIHSISNATALKAIDRAVRKGLINGLHIDWEVTVNHHVGAKALKEQLTKQFGFNYCMLRYTSGRWVGLPQLDRGVKLIVGTDEKNKSTELMKKRFSELLSEITMRLGTEAMKLTCFKRTETKEICTVEGTQ